MIFNYSSKLEGESPKYDENYHKKQFKSKNSQDIIKSIVEIVKNGVDAYIEEKGTENCNEEKIEIFIDRKDKSIRIINYAQGMDSQLFEKALLIGGDTGSKKDQKTGAHGYGMKEACWSFKESRIITIKEGKYSSRIFYWDENENPKYAWEKDEAGKNVKDLEMTSKIKSYTGINYEGTYIEGILPEEIKWLTFEALQKELSWHILLRSINQSRKFSIILTDITNKKKMSRQILYHLPQTINGSGPVSKGKFDFDYPEYGNITCSYEIFLSDNELNSQGDSKEAGILICAGQFLVLDCTSFDNGGKIANKFFGKAILEGPLREISKKERILDDRRISGLVKNTPLYLALSKHFGPILRDLIEKEIKNINKKSKDIEKGLIDNKEKLLRELNKIAKNEESSDTKGMIKFEPGEKGLRFCISGNYEKLLENEKKNIYLIADTKKIPLNSEIKIRVDKEGLEITPNEIKVLRKDIDAKGVFKKKINFYSKKINIFSIQPMANLQNNQITGEKIYLEVVEDPRLHLEKPFDFIKNEETMVEGSLKKIMLTLNKDKFKGENIILEDNDLIILSKEIDLNEKVGISEKIFEIPIYIFCKGKAGQGTKIVLKSKNHQAQLDVKIISSREKHLKGPFNDIKVDDEKNPEERGYFESDTKIIKVCINHPIFKHYIRSFPEKEDNIFYRTLYAETVVMEALKHLTRDKVRIFENAEVEEYRFKFDELFNNYYKKYAVPLHNFCIDTALNHIIEDEI